MKKEFAFKASTLEERREFYKKEFSLKKVKSWFKKIGIKFPQICALDAGMKTKILLDKSFDKKLFYFNFEEMEEKIKKYVPEGVYYDRNEYANPDKVLDKLNFKNRISQELVFDIDVDNIKNVSPENTQGYERYLDKAHDYAIKLKKELEKKFSKILVVYSGRGFHLHVVDKKAYALSNDERRLLVKRFSKYPIDAWVSRENIRLIRMPYTLNGIVSRVVTPISERKFYIEKTIPKFLKK